MISCLNSSPKGQTFNNCNERTVLYVQFFLIYLFILRPDLSTQLGWFGNYYVDQGGLEFTEICLSLSSQVLVLKTCTTMPSRKFFYVKTWDFILLQWDVNTQSISDSCPLGQKDAQDWDNIRDGFMEHTLAELALLKGGGGGGGGDVFHQRRVPGKNS